MNERQEHERADTRNATKQKVHAAEAAPERTGVLARAARKIVLFHAIGFWAALFLLTVAYLAVGDRTPAGEMLTLWPPILWLFIFIPFSLPWLLTRRFGRFASAVLALLLFLGATEEWRSLLRWRGTDGRVATSPKGVTLRVVTWNTAGADWGSVLAALEPHRPDLCFLQETSDLALDDKDRAGYWKDFEWIDSGDCALLSRFPLRPLATRPVGPWSDPNAFIHLSIG